MFLDNTSPKLIRYFLITTQTQPKFWTQHWTPLSGPFRLDQGPAAAEPRARRPRKHRERETYLTLNDYITPCMANMFLLLGGG